MLAKLAFFALLLFAFGNDQDDVKLLARAHNEFGVKLLKQLALEEPLSNIVLSPTSIASAFGMAYTGARGSSEAELGSVLGHNAVGLVDRARVLATYKNLLQLSKSPNVTLDVANLVLIQKGFPILECYQKQLRDVFDAELRSADFANAGSGSAEKVNAWVREKTRGKISGILPERQSLYIVLFILNAVYFKGTWLTKFDAADTMNRPFFNMGTSEVSRPSMLLTTRLPHTTISGLNASAVEIPYNGGKFGMVIVLPDNFTGLQALRDGLSATVLEVLDGSMYSKDVVLRLPKFEMNQRYDLVRAMEALGLHVVFGRSADFGRIVDGERVHISDAVHEAAIEVNEEGTIAAAVTGLFVMPSSSLYEPPPPIFFTVDHPFLYYIRDKDNNRILFIGEVHSL
uniref:Serine protease inhibitor 4 RmS4 n=1 Tax=Rhipicephalus microplus TaxID=6941 RepID=V9VJE7_RHIMP|nr:serine protease inhibitor 4 RmS4 [Rhipicephalus microplus]